MAMAAANWRKLARHTVSRPCWRTRLPPAYSPSRSKAPVPATVAGSVSVKPCAPGRGKPRPADVPESRRITSTLGKKPALLMEPGADYYGIHGPVNEFFRRVCF